MRKKSEAVVIAAVLLIASLILVDYYTMIPQTQTQTPTLTTQTTQTNQTTQPQPAQGFSLNVFPTRLRASAVAGELIVFLVTIADNRSTQTASSSESAKLSVTADDSAVLIRPSATILPGQVDEIEVIPDVQAVGSNITVAITAERAGLVQTQVVRFPVIQWYEDIDQRAAELRDMFVQWLQVNYPQLGITNQTVWQGSFACAQVLVVSHYLFYSKGWEMHVYWHNMIPPYDWARIDLRQRFNQTSYSLAFQIPDLNASLTTQPYTPTPYLWR